MEEFTLKLDAYGLLNLHKALLEAKFHENPDNRDVPGSPLVAEIYAQVRDLLIESDKTGQWENWFQLKNQPSRHARTLLHLKKCKRWDKASESEKGRLAADYLAPFLYSRAELSEVVKETDKNRASAAASR